MPSSKMRLKPWGRRRRKPPDDLNHRPATPSPLNATSEIPLEALHQSSDAFPPLKSVVGSIRYMLSVRDKVKSNKAACHELTRRSEAILYMIAEAVPDITQLSDDLLHRIENYTQLVTHILQFMYHLQRRNVMSRMVRHEKDEDDLVELNRKLDIKLMSFAYVSAIKTEVTILRLDTGIKESIDMQSELLSDRINNTGTKILMLIDRSYIFFFEPPPRFGASLSKI